MSVGPAGSQPSELAKLNGAAAALAEVLRRCGVTDPSAAVAAESGVAAFKVAFTRWVTDPADGALIDNIREAFQAQRLLLSASAPTR